jgi:hypothetical protein
LKLAPSLAFVAALATGSCDGDSSPTPTPTSVPPAAGDRVLFVGNRLTEANDLPLMMVEAITYGGVALEDHWNRGTQNRIAAGGSRFVVLQQGPSALPDSQANLREWTERFAAVSAREAGIAQAAAAEALHGAFDGEPRNSFR